MGRSTFTELHLSDSSNEQSLSKEFPQIFDSAFEFVAIYRDAIELKNDVLMSIFISLICHHV